MLSVAAGGFGETGGFYGQFSDFLPLFLGEFRINQNPSAVFISDDLFAGCYFHLHLRWNGKE